MKDHSFSRSNLQLYQRGTCAFLPLAFFLLLFVFLACCLFAFLACLPPLCLFAHRLLLPPVCISWRPRPVSVSVFVLFCSFPPPPPHYTPGIASRNAVRSGEVPGRREPDTEPFGIVGGWRVWEAFGSWCISFVGVVPVCSSFLCMYTFYVSHFLS